MSYPDRTETLDQVVEQLDRAAGALEQARALLFDLPDVSNMSGLVNRARTAVEVAQNAVHDGWEGEP